MLSKEYQINIERLDKESELVHLCRREDGTDTLPRFTAFVVHDLPKFGYTGEDLTNKVRGLAFEMAWHCRVGKQWDAVRYFEKLQKLLAPVESPRIDPPSNPSDGLQGAKVPRRPIDPTNLDSIALPLPEDIQESELRIQEQIRVQLAISRRQVGPPLSETLNFSTNF